MYSIVVKVFVEEELNTYYSPLIMFVQNADVLNSTNNNASEPKLDASKYDNVPFTRTSRCGGEISKGVCLKLEIVH